MSRNLPWLILIALTALCTLLALFVWPDWWIGTAVFGGLALIGLHDWLQRRHTLLRNYPVIAHFRWLFEALRPEIRQYLLESDDEAAPFSRRYRSLVYQRGKGANDKEPFGTTLNVYSAGYEWLNPSSVPRHCDPEAASRIVIGNDQCSQPYNASVFNISAMSFGSLSAAAIRALNRGAAAGGFAHDTGEGGISRYHREGGGDLIWEIGSSYFGCRSEDGRFNPERFAEQANDPQVRMIELKLSQGAKPGHGGILPASKVTAEIAAAREVPAGRDCISPAAHPEFDTPLEMMAFLARLRELSGGKPVGFKLCIGHRWEFMAMVKAMRASGIVPDFIVVDGAEGGTGAAPLKLSDHVGTPLREGLVFVHNTLVGAELRDRIRIGAAGKVASGFRIASKLAIGADWCNAARPFMFALGCIQSQHCHTDRCPTGVATQNPWRQRGLNVPDKAERVHRFHRETVAALMEVVGACGLTHPSQLQPRHLGQYGPGGSVETLDHVFRFMQPGELLAGTDDPRLGEAWRLAQAESFQPAA